ncbi:hypothetical protein [Bacillus wiedmannii]|uniref:hypothetical protein n=1 Tax=Bacillus wiedmannii TaxID=1890302 RepID=UPI0015D4F8DA|nr:hypothetical protein [Bacillus wiedmannii]
MSFIIKCPKCGEEQEFKSNEWKKGKIEIYLFSHYVGSGYSNVSLDINCDCGNSIEYEK